MDTEKVSKELAHKLMLRNMPVTPILEKLTDDCGIVHATVWGCPSCESHLYKFYKYCPYCGQRIDWTTEEEEDEDES